MTDKITLKVTTRKITGRKTRNLRKEGILPANIYGKDIKSQAVQLPTKDFKAAFKTAGETSIINLTLDKETKARPILVHNIHLHPVTDEFLHADFHQVDLTKKVTVAVPLKMIGEAPAVSKGGVLLQLMDEIEVEALPSDLPDKFEINISKLKEIGQTINLKDIKIPDKAKLMVDNLNQLVVKIEEPTKEEEKPEEKPEEEVPVEGEEPKEGEEAKPVDGKQEEGKSEDKQEEGKKPDSKPAGDSKAKPKEKKK